MKTKKNMKYYFLLLGIIFYLPIYGQNTIEVSGLVSDESGLPLPGVSIIIKNTTTGTASDFDGNYSLKANSNSILVFSYLGYKSLEVSVDGKSTLNVSLVEDASELDEVVVVGYGTVKKSDLTGSIASLDSKSLTERNFSNPLEAIQGNVAGVQISQSTGRVGDGLTVIIRGNNSLSTSTPLYVVDGVPTDNIDFLNPQDIARMDILKDASSAAIYGSRGGSGVIIVTTKGGSSAKAGMTISLDSYFGTKEVTRLPKMMGGEKWWYYHQSAYLATTNSGDVMNTTPAELHASVIGTANSVLEQRALANDTFDWYDAVLKSGIQQNNYLSISGRAENGMAYNLGFGIQNETGNIENESLDKYSFKVGVKHNISDKFSTGVNLTIARTESQQGSDRAMEEAFRLNPFLTPYGLDGELYPQPGKLNDENGNSLINKTSTYNPLLEIANSSDEINRWTAVGNVFLKYQVLDWLSFKTTYSAGMNTYRRGRSWGALTNTGKSNGGLPSGSIENSENYNYTWDNQFNIDYTVDDDHTFSFLGLQSLYSNKTEYSSLSSREQPFDTGFYNLGSGISTTYNLGSDYQKYTLSSYAARLNYTYKGKYLFTASNRWDGSSVLAEGNKWESFPSIALGWKINEESFLENSSSVSNLKLRLSYGFTGNDTVDPYTTLNGLNSQTYYNYLKESGNGWLASSLANSELGWEKTREFNAGIDFGFFSNKVSGSIDVYDRLSEDLIFNQKLALETGWDITKSNVGSISNKGVEVMLTTRNIETKDVSWSTTFTFTKNTNKLVSIYNQKEVSDIGNNLHLGESINSYYNYVFDGIWQADERAEAASYGQSEGQAKVKDLNGDGVIDANNDRKILGNSDPDWTGSFTSKLRVKNFDLSISAITSQGVLAYSNFHANFTNTRDRGRQKLDIADWYIPENTAGIPAQFSNKYPQARNVGTYWRNDGVGYYRDASFVKIKNISLGYTFSQSVLDKFKMKYLRVYANVLNPFVFTDYDGYDPEWATAPLRTGRVASTTYQLGLSLKF